MDLPAQILSYGYWVTIIMAGWTVVKFINNVVCDICENIKTRNYHTNLGQTNSGKL